MKCLLVFGLQLNLKPDPAVQGVHGQFTPFKLKVCRSKYTGQLSAKRNNGKSRPSSLVMCSGLPWAWNNKRHILETE